MPDADWWAKVARDRPGGEGMTVERTCPKSPHGVHADPDTSGQCIYCGRVLDGSDVPIAGVPMSAAMRTPVAKAIAELTPITDEDLARIELYAAGDDRVKDLPGATFCTKPADILRLVAEVRRLREAIVSARALAATLPALIETAMDHDGRGAWIAEDAVATALKELVDALEQKP